MIHPRWKKIGYQEEFCADVLKGTRDGIEQSDIELPLNSPKTGTSARLFRLVYPTVISVFRHLEVRVPKDDLSDWEYRVREIPSFAVQYFHGPWRDGFVNWDGPTGEPLYGSPHLTRGPLTVVQCRQQLEWIDILRYGLLWSLFFDDESNLSKLIVWPDTDLREDEGIDDLTKADCDYYILLCKWLRGEMIDPKGPINKSICEASKKRPKLLLAVLEATIKDDSVAYGKAMLESLRHYQKVDFHTRAIHRSISMEATILWHIARRRCLTQPALPESLEHLILRHETLPPTSK